MPSDTKMHSSAKFAWAERLVRLVDRYRHDDSKAVREELWLLLSTAVSLCFARHERTLGFAQPEDREDLVSEKTLELLSQIDSGKWKPQIDRLGEAYGYVSSCVRNGFVDQIRSRATKRRILEESGHSERLKPVMIGQPAADVDCKAFSEALRDCAETLSKTHRRIWRFRVFYGMSSKLISEHPEVRATPGHVDVIQSECRKKIRACMSRKGFDASDLQPGSFAALWEAFGMDRCGEVPHER